MADQDNPGAVDQNLPAVIQGDFNLDECDIFSDVIALIPYEVAERHKIIPISRQGSIINIAMADSSNVYALDDVKFLTGLTAEAVPTSLDQIERALVKYYSDEESREAHRRALEELDSPEEDSSVVCEPPSANLGSLVSSTDDAPVVRLVNMILVDAVRRGATTIHLETYANDFRVRYRMEDRMFEIMRPPLRYKDSMLARLKVMANFNMKGRGLPQKGVIKLVIGREKNVSFNVSTMPTAHGEKMVIQVLDISNARLRLENLGLEDRPFKEFDRAINGRSGLVLVTGPVGSGRQTTLYASLVAINSPERNIFSVEEAAMVDLPGVNQILLRPDDGLDLEMAIRNLSSQDVDVLMVGESPWEKKNVDALVKTSLSGRLVLAPFQAEEAVSTISSLLDLGVTPFMLTSSLSLVCAQRLARRICERCITPAVRPIEALVEAGFTLEDAGNIHPQKGVGCRYCNQTGYKGFVGIFQVLPMYDEFKKILLRGAPISELRQQAMLLGIKSLRQDGLLKVKYGVTTLEEVLRVTPAD